jgi:hypothetical protein
MIDAAMGALGGLMLGLLVGTLLTDAYHRGPKDACEETLPRNIECVWAAPTGDTQ